LVENAFQALFRPKSKMSQPEIQEKLTKTFHKVFGDNTLVINPAMTASDVKGWDSLTHVRLLLTVERTFRISITASEAGKLQTVGDLMQLIQSKAG
jgi:acyl carrier protein